MNAITRDELIMGLTQYYQDFADNPDKYDAVLTTNPAADAEAVTNAIFEIIQSNHA